MTSRLSLFVFPMCLLATACGAGGAAAGDSAAPSAGQVPYAYERIPLDTTRSPGAVIDSVFPMPEMIRRFRDGLPVTATLRDGAPSRDSLIARFVAALAARETQTLGQLALSRAEFAYVYVPQAPEVNRANGLPPQRLWDQVVLTSEKGIGRALDRLGGKPLVLQRVTCDAPPVSTGTLRLQSGCTVRLRLDDGSEFSGRLFGPIVEHGGRFKFLGYANDM